MLLSTVKHAARGKTTNYLKNLLHELNSKTSAMSDEVRDFNGMATEASSSSTAATATAANVGETKKQPQPPKQPKQSQQLRRDKQQLAAKKKTVPYVPGTVSLQVLGAGANGAPCAVYLFTDQSRYLFNCGEGTQRLAHEHKTKLSRLEQIFVTRNTWCTMGGLPGLALTVQDAGVKELALHGPPQLDSILHSMKRFVVLKALQVKTLDCTQTHDFEDQVMSVQCVPLHKTVATTDSSDTAAGDNVVIAYICQLKPRPGMLLLEKCVERGVPPGPLLGLLKNGIDVTLDNGTVVRSRDVSEPGETALSFIFVDIPSADYLPALEMQSARFHNLELQAEQAVALVVHFTPAEMLENNCYQHFMQKFSKKTQHIYLNSPKNTFSGYVAAHRIQYQLNLLNERVFPLLGESELQCNSLSSKLKKTKLVEAAEEETLVDVAVTSEDEKQSPQAVNGVHSMSSYHMRPRKGFDHTQAAKLNPTEYIQETQALEDFPALIAQLKAATAAKQPSAETLAYPKITFLGTGSCIPNKTRNVSAIIVQTAADAYIVLDCGEGTLGQIVRFFGKQKAETVIKQLHAIYVSHLHADHHIGLIGLLNERQRLGCDRPLTLFAPKQIQSWLEFYNARIEHINNAYELIGNGELLEQPMPLAHKNMGLHSIQTCMVRHCPHSFGVSLTLQTTEKPVKITYSGDTMPCKDLVQLGRDSTILIHEATMEDDLIEEAKVKMHSTISQAIKQGRDMQAEHIILTHFSQRYAKLPRMSHMSSAAEEEAAMRNVSIAFDNMQVTLSDLQDFHMLYPALKALFAEHAEELEQKALKRELKLERKRKLLNVD